MKRACTGSPNFDRRTQDCCEQHDKEYGPLTYHTRAEADRRLLMCVAANGRPWRAILMFIFVRAFWWIFYRG